MKQYILLTILVQTLAFGDIYGGYSLEKINAIKKANADDVNVTKGSLDASFFTKDYFSNIIRYKPVFFNGETIDGESEAVIEQVLRDLNSSDLNTSRLSIIGHTSESVDLNSSVKMNGYVEFFQKIVTPEGDTPQEDFNLSKKRAEIVYEHLLDHNISKEIMYVTQRSGKDKLYTEGIDKGRKLNNWVDIALYTIEDKDHDGVLDPDDKCPDTHKGLVVDEKGCSGNIRLDVLFKLNSAEVESENNGSVRAFSDFLIENAPYHAVVVGHTDAQGRAEYNQRLSERRARTVVDMLVTYGVARERLRATGRGESEPLVTEAEVFKMQNQDNNETKPLSKEELKAIHATNRRIEVHYFLPLDTVVLKSKPKAPRLRYKPEPKKPKKRAPRLRFKVQ